MIKAQARPRVRGLASPSVLSLAIFSRGLFLHPQPNELALQKGFVVEDVCLTAWASGLTRKSPTGRHKPRHGSAAGHGHARARVPVFNTGAAFEGGRQLQDAIYHILRAASKNLMQAGSTTRFENHPDKNTCGQTQCGCLTLFVASFGRALGHEFSAGWARGRLAIKPPWC